MKNKIHLICNAHLDPVWQWRWTEGCSEAIATFRNAVEIIEEYPELIFNHNEAILYKWVKKYDSRLYARIRELVENKRWFIAGGWFLQPDVNLPPYENLVRHIRFGREYFRDEFGVEPRVAYNFDSFGHPAGLPKLLRDFGYELYIHQRPEREHLKLPDSLYSWKGLDGVTIPAYRIEIGLYHTERTNIVQRLSQATEMALELNRDVALFWGLGDHGGGATRLDLDKIREFTANENRVEFIHSTTDRFCDSIRHRFPELPEYSGSLQRVFAGCYTSLSRVKRKAVESSAAALQAEKLLEASELKVQTTDIWEDILFNDFHDILPGSCTEPAEQDALDLYGRALENIRRLNMLSITGINQSSSPLKAHIPITLFNSNRNLSTFPVEFECMSDYRPFWEGEWTLKLFDRQGNEIPSQEEQPEARLPFHRWRRKISFLARNTGYGVHHYYLKPEASPAETPGTAKFSGKLMGPLPEFQVMKDTADSWGTGTIAWNDRSGTFSQEKQETPIEQGPVRIILESTWVYGKSKIILRRILYHNWPVTVIEARIHWNEEQNRMKVAFPSPGFPCRLFAQIPGGWEEFNPDGLENVHGTCLRLQNAEPGAAKRSLFIAHNGLHGFDFDGKTVRLSALRSAAYCHEQGYNLNNRRSHKFMDIGIHDIRLAVWSDSPDSSGGDFQGTRSTEALPADLSDWLNAPPLVWPHLPIG